jgi:hypothetical protein
MASHLLKERRAVSAERDPMHDFAPPIITIWPSPRKLDKSWAKVGNRLETGFVKRNSTPSIGSQQT